MVRSQALLLCMLAGSLAHADYYWTCGGQVELRDLTAVPANDKTCQPAAKGDTRKVSQYDAAGNLVASWVEVWNGAQWVRQ